MNGPDFWSVCNLSISFKRIRKPVSMRIRKRFL